MTNTAQKPRLSIGMPSNRALALSLESVESAAAFCRKSGYQFALSDNTSDAAKTLKMQNVMQGANMTYLQSPPCGMIDNWFNAFNNTDGDFVLMMGDDDTIFSFGASPNFADLPADVVGIKPNIAAYAEPHGVLRFNDSGIQSTSGPSRVEEYLQQTNGMNLGIFSFWRRDVFKSIMELWFRAHPTKATYCDWAVMCALVSSGRVARDPMSCYFYNLQNWGGDQAQIAAQIEKAFVKSGLPAGTAPYGPLLNAIDSFIFISRQDSPLQAQERFLTAIYTFDLYLKSYLNNIPQTAPHPHAAEILALSNKLVGNDSVTAIFAIIADILEAIQPCLGQKYKDFCQQATGMAWGAM